MPCASGFAVGRPNADMSYVWNLPNWVPPPNAPAENPMSYAKAELGRHLFYDKGLSANRVMACATCHLQAKAFTDGRAAPVGVTGEKGVRSAMTLANVAYAPVLSWANPQVTSLEKQALIPLFGEHRVKMGMAWREKDIFARFKVMPKYRELFAKAYPMEVGQGDDALYFLSTMTRALASFQRGLMSFNSPYDHFKYGNKPNAITPAAKRGEKLFLASGWSAITATAVLISATTSSIRAYRMLSADSTTRACTTWTVRGLTQPTTQASPNSQGTRLISANFAHPACATSPSRRRTCMTAVFQAWSR